MPSAKASTFSLYLAKRDVTAFEQLLTENARKLVEKKQAVRTVSSAFGQANALFTFPGPLNVPKWVTQLSAHFTMPTGLFSQSCCAILAFKQDDHTFAVTYSYGHVYLDDAKTEADFGLKVAINAVSDEKLRSVERSNIGAAIRDFAQAAGHRDLKSFGFDDALDLIRKVSGRAADGEFADMVSGSRALRFSKRIELGELPQASLEAVSFFRSTAYRKTAFKLIDFLSPVQDTAEQARLDTALVGAIRDGTDEFEIAIPEIVPDDLNSFRFEHAGFSKFHPDLSLELYRLGFGGDLPKLTLEDLRKHSVAAYTQADATPPQSWSVYDALVGSTVSSGERYAINEGLWYRINRVFKERADSKFEELCAKPDRGFRPLKKIYKPGEKGKKPVAAYQSEESYNEEIAAETRYLLMDEKLVTIDDVAGPGIEVCDLLDIEGRRFIHVKKSSRQSSILSHFFKQGGNAAQMIRKYEPFKGAMIEKVKELYGSNKAKEFEAALAKRWTVEFQIADFPRADGTHNIPFFSKLTLREEARNIEAMGFDVRLRFITLARIEEAN